MIILNIIHSLPFGIVRRQLSSPRAFLQSGSDFLPRSAPHARQPPRRNLALP